MIRLFAALAVPPSIAARLAALQSGLGGARWRPAEALHVTLRFFGDIDEVAASEVDEALSEVAGEPFELTLAGVGYFGAGRQMRAVWAGVEETPHLRRLAARCESAARRCGLKPDTRLYTPHVTLAYLKDADPHAVAAWVQSHNLQRQPPFEVAAFGLYSSWQGRKASTYQIERSYPLAPAQPLNGQ
jgi:2'-5' RNA ligase